MNVKSKRIYLTNISYNHIDYLYKWWNDGDVMRSMGFPNGMNVEKKDLIERFKNQIEFPKKSLSTRMYIIYEADQNKAIGEVQYGEANFEKKSCRLGIKIGEVDYHGRGYGKEALTLFINFLFSEYQMERIDIDVFPENAAGVHLYKNIGFKEVELLKSFWKDETGLTHDLLMLSLERKDWKLSDYNI